MHQQFAAAGDLIAQGQQAGRWGIAKIQITVRVVLDDQGLVLDGHVQHLAPALGIHERPAGIAKSGNQVNEFGFVLGDQLFQLIGLDAMTVHRSADQLGTIKAKALDGGQKSRAFHDHLVARADHGFADQIQRLLAASGHDQLLRGHFFGPLLDHKLGQLFAQRPVAFGGTVLQSRARV